MLSVLIPSVDSFPYVQLLVGTSNIYLTAPSPIDNLVKQYEIIVHQLNQWKSKEYRGELIN